MRYRKLSELDDYVFGNSQLDFYRDVPEAVGQSVKTRLLLWVGEWFLNIEDGTPYLQGILGKYSETEANDTIQDRVIDTVGVTTLEDYQSIKNPEDRNLSVQFSINTIYGPTEVEIANYTNY